MDNYQEYVRKSKDIENQQDQLKKRKNELKRQKLKLLMDRVDKRKENLQKNIVDVNHLTETSFFLEHPEAKNAIPMTITATLKIFIGVTPFCQSLLR